MNDVGGVGTIGRNTPGRGGRQQTGTTAPVIYQPPARLQMEAAAVDQFDDKRPIGRPLSGRGKGGIPGMEFNTEQTCNPDGQCWQVVSGTKEDRANYARYQEYLKAQSKDPLETLGDAIGDAANFVKNVAAGVINSTIPGSDLGDAGNPGQLVGGVLGLVANPGGAILGAVTKGAMALNLGGVVSTISNTIGKANQFLTSPLGQIGSSVVGGLVSGAIQPAVNVAYPGAVRTSPLVPDATLYPGYRPRIGGMTGGLSSQGLMPIKVSTPVGTVDTTKSSPVNVWLIAAAAAVALLFFMRKK